MIDARCQIIAVVIPQYIDAGFKRNFETLGKVVWKESNIY